MAPCSSLGLWGVWLLWPQVDWYLVVLLLPIAPKGEPRASWERNRPTAGYL